MNEEKLKQNPLPIDRVAYRVVKKAKPEEVWLPEWKRVEHIKFSKEVLPVGPLPKAAPASIREVIGKRRGKMKVIGYAKDQDAHKSKNAQWVVRCDCGNYEHRTKILRWLGTHADDSCRECRNRAHLLIGGRAPSLPPAQRDTKAAA